jgi:hypothetical protein
MWRVPAVLGAAQGPLISLDIAERIVKIQKLLPSDLPMIL